MIETLEGLRVTSWRTASCRYDACRRLKRRDRLATFSLAIFSTLTIAVAVVQRVYEIKQGSSLDNYLTVLSIVLGIGILIVSLIEWGTANAAGAESLFRNAKRLQDFQRSLGVIIADARANNLTITALRCNELESEYAAIKRDCTRNHEPMDDKLFMVSHKNDPALAKHRSANISFAEEIAIKISWHARSLGYIPIVWVVVLTAIAIAVIIELNAPIIPLELTPHQ